MLISLINLLPLFVTLTGAALFWAINPKYKNLRFMVITCTILFVFLYTFLQPGLKKNVATHKQIQVEEPKNMDNVEVRDRLLKPKDTIEERQERFDSKFTVMDEVKEILNDEIKK